MSASEGLLSWLPSVLSVIGLIGAAASFVLTWQRENEKARKAKITEVYSNWIRVQSENASVKFLGLSQKEGAGEKLEDKDIEFLASRRSDNVKANSEMALYGSPGVIKALSEFYDLSIPIGNPEAPRAFASLFSAMRQDVVAEDYYEFGQHVDNILGTGPDKRRAALVLASQPSVAS